MADFTFEVNGIEIKVQKPQKDFCNEESLRYDEINLIITKFEKKFPHISLKDDTFEDLNCFSEKNYQYANLQKALSEKYSADMDDMDRADMENLYFEMRASLDQIIDNNKILTILLMDNEILPMSIADAVDKYCSGNDSLEAKFQRKLY